MRPLTVFSERSKKSVYSLSAHETPSSVSPLVRTLLDELKARLSELYGERLTELVLYGSYARGTARQGSDLDVAMVLEEGQRPWLEIDRTGPVVAALSLKYGLTISLIPVRRLDWDRSRTLLTRTLHREGVLVA